MLMQNTSQQKLLLPSGLAVWLVISLMGWGATACQAYSMGSSSRLSVALHPESLPVLAEDNGSAVPVRYHTSSPVRQTGASLVKAGDVIYVRDGQVWAIATDGATERQIASFPAGTVIQSTTLSPNSRFLAMLLNGQQLAIVDVTTGTISQLAQVGIPIAPIVWTPDSSSLFYLSLSLSSDTQVPRATQLWQVAVPPANQGILITDIELTPSGGITPVAAASNGWLLVEVGNDIGGEFFLFDPVSQDLIPLAEGLAPLGLAPDRTQVLLLERDGLYSAANSVPAGLLIADLSIPEGISNISSYTDSDDTSRYQWAQFAPDGARVIALRNLQASTISLTQPVLLSPASDGGIAIVELAAEPERIDVAIEWYSEEAAIVQRMNRDTPQGEIWLVPLDGTDGRIIARGDAPQVVRSLP